MSSTPSSSGPATPRLSAAQRRAVNGADPDTGEMDAAPATCRALVAAGLAVKYGQRGAHYLTRRGWQVRDGADGAPGGTPEPTAEEAPPGPEVFAAATGDGPRTSDTEGRRRAVATAWAGLLEIRRVTGADEAAVAAPAAWERARMVSAVALALEGAGITPSAVDASGRHVRDGYRVAESSSQPHAVSVSWMSAQSAAGRASAPTAPAPAPAAEAEGEVRRQLGRCAHALERAGWHATEHTDRAGHRFLLASPKHA
ncbi:hypothetical protein [Wenjunlia tyrosinilytica]|uniref:Uncharacterized protein n=1 Tax=Wenjunlia tyrosinilytica TaxID=1544741 RepID=A0A917ZUR5_9ACTN|nr:hypothetical protein [Wenjunlia tyrosinilytica]GGO94084.1 hypothetical protein GCM10012280_48100 [Wenjunlia tyrosinilytica]